jgi:hypothetical protein
MKATSSCEVTAVVTATPAVAMTGAGRIMAIAVCGGSDASSAAVYDSPTSAAGTAVYTMKVGTALSQFHDFSEVGGIPCASGAWVVPAGTGAVCYIWTE